MGRNKSAGKVLTARLGFCRPLLYRLAKPPRLVRPLGQAPNQMLRRKTAPKKF
ncbi:MAG: hypothetical protein L0209_06585 [candidate division Zixibacteria bacterium]|nr:hypothetical protein [candidate division Zixibacteria bacterium]